MKVLVLGCGKMSSAIVEAKFKAKSTIQFYCYTPTQTSARIVADKVNGHVIANLDQIDFYDLIIIGCKPQQFQELSQHLKSKIHAQSVVVSIMAGINITKLINDLAHHKIVRIMPNTPIANGIGVSLIYNSEQMTDVESEMIMNFFKAISDVYTVDSEKQFDHLTPLVGSGPALLYEFYLAFVEQLDRYGIESSLAQNIVKSVFHSSAKFAKMQDRPLIEMIADITSKAGITFAALNSLEGNQFKKSVGEAYQSAYRRNQKLNS